MTKVRALDWRELRRPRHRKRDVIKQNVVKTQSTRHWAATKATRPNVAK
jgi:uncharacterized protein with FMN-binding domain